MDAPNPVQGKDLADINVCQMAEIERKRQAEIKPERVRKREFSRKSRGYDGPSFWLTIYQL